MEVVDIVGGVEGGKGGCDDRHDMGGVVLVLHGVPRQQCFERPVVTHVLHLVEQHGCRPLPVREDLEEYQQPFCCTSVVLV